MNNFYYDICIHGDDYEEKKKTSFSNPINVGDHVRFCYGDTEYVVFQVVHCPNGGGSSAHVREEI